MSSPRLPDFQPLQIKERISILSIEKGQIDVVDGAFVVIDKNGIREQIPLGAIACLMLEPGTRISHAAVKLASDVGTLLIWIGEGGVRLYASGQPGGARSDRLLWQAKICLDDQARLNVVRGMYKLRFGDDAPKNRSIEQLRGIEGARVKSLYVNLAKKYKVIWRGRNYDPDIWEQSDDINRCLSVANSCLYGVCEAAILASGYAPSIGFIHSGKPLSFVYDIADIYKFETVVPLAFKIASTKTREYEKEVRYQCRDIFRSSKILKRIIPQIHRVLAFGGIDVPKIHQEAIRVAIPKRQHLGDLGHR